MCKLHAILQKGILHLQMLTFTGDLKEVPSGYRGRTILAFKLFSVINAISRHKGWWIQDKLCYYSQKSTQHMTKKQNKTKPERKKGGKALLASNTNIDRSSLCRQIRDAPAVRQHKLSGICLYPLILCFSQFFSATLR